MRNPCLVIIDLQNDFLNQWAPADVDRLITNTNSLIEHFRRAALPVIWVRQEFEMDLSDAFLEMREKSVAVTIRGTPGAELHSRLDRRPHDHNIVKNRYSAFFKTGLDDLLAKLDTDEIVLCGINTHACIRTAAIDAYQRDFKVALPSECIGSYDDEHAQVSLRYMNGKIARVTTIAAIAALLGPGT